MIGPSVTEEIGRESSRSNEREAGSDASVLPQQPLAAYVGMFG